MAGPSPLAIGPPRRRVVWGVNFLLGTVCASLPAGEVLLWTTVRSLDLLFVAAQTLVLRPRRRRQPELAAEAVSLLAVAALVVVGRGLLLALPWPKVVIGIAAVLATPVVLVLGPLGLLLSVVYALVPAKAELTEHQIRLRRLLRDMDASSAEVPVEAEARYERIRELAREHGDLMSFQVEWMTVARQLAEVYALQPDVEALRGLRADAAGLLATADLPWNVALMAQAVLAAAGDGAERR